jgi:hypothetical protein
MTHAASRAAARGAAPVSNAIKPDVTPEDRPRQATGFVPTSRLDALTDAVFAFAMTLLVINIELPDDLHPKTTQAFLQGLAGLSDTFVAYLITFLVPSPSGPAGRKKLTSRRWQARPTCGRRCSISCG